MTIASVPFRTTAWTGACAIMLLFAGAAPVRAQPVIDPQADAELRKRLAPLVPSFQKALQSDSVDAQRATLAVIADIPPSLVVGTNLSAALKTFLRRDIKDPEILALGLRSFGRSFPDAADIEPIIGRHVRDDQVIVRRAAADGLASAVANSTPQRTAERRYQYFVDVAKQAIPALGVAVADADPATQKAALAGLRTAADVMTSQYTVEIEPLEPEVKPKDRQGRFGAFTPVTRALAAAVARFRTPLRSPDVATRLAAARTLESFALLRRAIKSSGTPGEPEPADPFVGGWKYVGESVAAGVKDPSPDVRLAMTEALESLGDAVEARALMQGATHDRVVFVRWAAARALGESAPPKADAKVYAPDVAALTALLDDRDIDVRTAAINALAKFGPAAKSAAPQLLAEVGKGDIEPRVAAVTALGAVGSDADSTVPVLIEGLKNKDLRLRRAAAAGLVRFGPAARPALSELRRALADPDTELRLAAAEAVLAIEKLPRLKEL